MPPAMKTLVLWPVMALVVVIPVEGLAAPMQKVIGALEKMQATSEEEMQEEKIQFTKFDQFCSATLDAKKKAIQQTTVTLESITSEISRLDSEAEKMATEIAQHEAAIKNSQTQQSNATELRKAEEENFNATHLDLQESIVAIQKALQQLKKEDYDRPQSTSSFVQSKRVLGGLERSEAVAKALALAGAFRNKPVPPKADAYEFQSGSIIEVLEDLKDQFKKQIAEVESVETKKKNSHELLLSSLDSEIKVNKKATEKKSGFKDSALGRKAEAEAKKSDVMAGLEADEKYRNDLSVECKVKGDDFAERQRVRSDEIQAMKKAIDILRNPSFLQSSQTPMSPFAKASSLALLRSANRSPSIAEAMQFLQKRAEELHSQSLQNLLVRLQQVPNVAVENIVKMLKEKLEKLQTEDVDDSKQKVWCKDELSENGEARETKGDEVENLKAEIEQLQSLLVQRSEENEELADDITKMDKSIQEATAMRNEEKASNLKSLKEATEGKEALSAAMDVLQSFYQSLALVQQSAVKQRLRQEGREIKPEFSAGGYSGQSGQNSIIALLQKVAADFAKEASGLKAAEDAAASEFKQFLSNTKSDRKKKEITQQHNTMSMTSETASLEQRKKDLASTEKQLDAALEYYEELKTKCLNSNTRFADARKKREEEIKSLQNAYKILSVNL